MAEKNFDGKDLLKVFEDLNIKVIHTDRNVIKSWFDTDDKNMINLLNWMCSLSKEKNYVSPLEIAEYSKIRVPLSGEDLKKEKQQVELKYPGIFDPEFTSLEIEYLEDELNMLHQNEIEFEQASLTAKNIQENLKRKLTSKSKQHIEESVNLKNTEENCLLVSQKLDALNQQIYDNLLESANLLHNYEFSSSPCFISNYATTPFQEKVEKLYSVLQELEETFPYVKSTMNDTLATVSMRDRLFYSQSKYIATQVELEKVNSALTYLDKVSISDLGSSGQNALTQCIGMHTNNEKELNDMLEDALNKYADYQIDLENIQTLEIQRAQLNDLTELETMVQRLLSHYSVLQILFDIEKEDMKNIETFFKQSVNYVEDLNNFVTRTKKMEEKIHLYQSSASKETPRLAKLIIKTLSGAEENFTLDTANGLILNLKREIQFLESKHFLPSFKHIKNHGKELRESIKVLQSFLASGPTNRILLVPAEIQIVIRQIEDILKNELKSIASALNTIDLTKKRQTKWENYRRQLWMYFYADPSGMMKILQQSQNEKRNHK